MEGEDREGGKGKVRNPRGIFVWCERRAVALHDDGYDAALGLLSASLASSTTRYFVTVTAGCEKKVLAAVLWLF